MVYEIQHECLDVDYRISYTKSYIRAKNKKDALKKFNEYYDKEWRECPYKMYNKYTSKGIDGVKLFKCLND